jgi:hypothetical protein
MGVHAELTEDGKEILDEEKHPELDERKRTLNQRIKSLITNWENDIKVKD